MEELREEIEYLYGLERLGMIFGLENVSGLLKLLGDPHLRLKAVHVAGTNGKGSVCAMLHAILGRRYRVGLYTSPHLHRLNERIKIEDEIQDQELLQLIRLLRAKVREADRPKTFTFFDFITALAFFYFAQKGVDLALVEVGLGGRLDSTNVIKPLVAVITNVGHDHMDVLGGTLQDVAREKAGIIKEGTVLICGERKPDPLEVILKEAERKGATVYLLGRDFGYRYADGLSFWGRKWRLQGLRLGLLGRHQGENAALALATLEVLTERGFELTETDIRKGLEEVRWPGRLELFEGRPRVLLDGAHNPEGMESLCEALSEIPHRALHLIIGIMADKPWSEMLRKILPLTQRVIAFKPNNPRALDPGIIVQEVRTLGLDAFKAQGAEEALRIAMESSDPEDLIVVAGSLFTVAEVREVLSSVR